MIQYAENQTLPKQVHDRSRSVARNTLTAICSAPCKWRPVISVLPSLFLEKATILQSDTTRQGPRQGLLARVLFPPIQSFGIVPWPRAEPFLPESAQGAQVGECPRTVLFAGKVRLALRRAPILYEGGKVHV